MTDEEFAAAKKRVMLLAEFWEPKLGLETWRIRYHFCRSRVDMPEEQDATAVTKAHWDYLFADIYWCLDDLPEDDDFLEAILVHELMHVHLNELHAKKDKASHHERVATQLARAFICLRDATKREAIDDGS